MTPSCWFDRQTRRRQHAIEPTRVDGVAIGIK
jgi:hypothetical protein